MFGFLRKVYMCYFLYFLLLLVFFKAGPDGRAPGMHCLMGD